MYCTYIHICVCVYIYIYTYTYIASGDLTKYLLDPQPTIYKGCLATFEK